MKSFLSGLSRPRRGGRREPSPLPPAWPCSPVASGYRRHERTRHRIRPTRALGALWCIVMSLRPLRGSQGGGGGTNRRTAGVPHPGAPRPDNSNFDPSSLTSSPRGVATRRLWEENKKNKKRISEIAKMRGGGTGSPRPCPSLELVLPTPASVMGVSSSPGLPRQGQQVLPTGSCEVVLHDPRNQKMVVWDPHIGLAHVQSTKPAVQVCPFCQQELPDSGMQWQNG